MTTDKLIRTAPAAGRTDDFVLSANPDRAIEEMMQAIDALRAVYLEENAALEKADTAGFLALQDCKISVARAYQSGASQMIDRKAEFKAKVGPEMRRKLQARQEEFSAISRRNLESLERMRQCTRRLGDRIMDQARSTARMDTHRYGAKGRMEENDRRVSIGINESA